jgi:hypothetical protein
VVNRHASNSIEVRSLWPFTFYLQKSNFDQQRIEFRHPDTQEHIVWQGERYFLPVLIDIVERTPYVVVYGRPDKKTEEIYGCPELPYIYLQYTDNSWRPVPVERAPRELLNANLSVYDIRSNDGRHLSREDVGRDVKFFERQSDGQVQTKIPRTYDEWHTKYKNSARNERRFGDCRLPPQPLPDIPLPKPTDADLEMVESYDYVVATSDEYYKSLSEKTGHITRDKCSMLFKAADRENVMLGELFVNDPTGLKKLPYTGPIPFPSGRMLEKRAERYCNDKFVWFVAEHEEVGKTVITKYNLSGDFLYNVRINNPNTADNNLARQMVLDSMTTNDGYVQFFWQQSLPTVQGPPTKYWHRMTKFRFKEPM